MLPSSAVRSGGDRATAVAIGAHGRPLGQEEVAKLMDVRRLERFISPRGVGVFTQWSVFLIETQAALIRSSVQIACNRPWNTVSSVLPERAPSLRHP